MSDRRSALEELRRDLAERLKRFQAHQHREDGALNPDFSEQAVERQNDEVVDGLENEVRAELVKVNRALERIEEGSGEECERCGAAINPARLKALPYATLCISCADAEYEKGNG
ncbi:MAG: TraR/DksA family transcriptional regulator [Marinobacter sp.]|uniref:TraR/DksA family transcriptional regulator n=1 Tax=Marinobacter sp. TaxID=50741 RepID=UPI0034A05A3E